MPVPMADTPSPPAQAAFPASGSPGIPAPAPRAVGPRPALFAALAAGAVMGLLLVVLAARRGPAPPEVGSAQTPAQAATIASAAATDSAPAAQETAAAEGAEPADAPMPSPAGSATAEAEAVDAGGPSEADPAATGAARTAPAAPAAPKGVTTPGK